METSLLIAASIIGGLFLPGIIIGWTMAIAWAVFKFFHKKK